MASAIDAESRPPHSMENPNQRAWTNWHVADARTHYGNQGPYKVAVLIGNSTVALGIELIEPQVLDLSDQVLILRGYERLASDDGPFTVLQEWRCEPG